MYDHLFNLRILHVRIIGELLRFISFITFPDLPILYFNIMSSSWLKMSLNDFSLRVTNFWPKYIFEYIFDYQSRLWLYWAVNRVNVIRASWKREYCSQGNSPEYIKVIKIYMIYMMTCIPHTDASVSMYLLCLCFSRGGELAGYSEAALVEIHDPGFDRHRGQLSGP